MRTATAYAASTLHAPVVITREFTRNGTRHAEVTTLPGGVGGWSVAGKELTVNWTLLRDITPDTTDLFGPTTPATAIVDALAERVYALVVEVNRGQEVTEDQFTAAFQRTFKLAFARLVRDLTEASPTTAAAFVEAYCAEFESAHLA